MKTLSNTGLFAMDKKQDKMKKKVIVMEVCAYTLLTIVTAALMLLVYNLLMIGI